MISKSSNRFKYVVIFQIFHSGRDEVIKLLLKNDASVDNDTSPDVLFWAVEQSNLLHTHLNHKKVLIY